MNKTKIAFWKFIPTFRLLLPFVSGILFQEYLNASYQFMAIVFASIAVCWILSFTKEYSWHYRNPWLKGVLLNLAIFVSGAIILQSNRLPNDTEWFGNKKVNNTSFLLEFEEPLSEKANSYGGKAKVTAIVENNQWIPVKGKLLVYFKKEQAILRLNYGSRIIIQKSLQPIRSNGNPGSFDFAAYCRRQQCFHQVYLTPADFKELKSKGGNTLYTQIYKLRAWMIYAFRRMIKSKEELGLVEALVIGFKEDLDKELVQSYSATGTVHVIAISGLHLGLIFWVINALLEMLPHHKLMKYPKLLLTLTALWGFALLAGGGPSVLRSALMFTCILIGKTMHRHSSSLNSICVAGFMLLLYNPYWLWDTGFQLSFAAVVSIICYQQSIYAFFEIRNKWMDKIWSATSVTLAAQILTLPFCIYYFHQFPVYFLLTNLVAVPLSSLVLLGALLLLALAPFHSIANRFGFAIEWLAGLMNKFIRLMESMPYGSWKYLQIDFMQATFMMLGILSTSLYLGKINKSWLWSAFGCSILVLFSRTISFNQAANQNLLIIYQLKKNSLIELVEGRYSSKIKINNTSLKILSINDPSLNASIQMRYEGTNDKYDDSHSVLSIGVGKRKLIVLQSDLRKLKPKSNHSSDWLLVTGNTKGNADSLISYFKPGEVILDGSNSISNVAKWKKACQHQVIPFYSTEEQGAFVMQLE